MCGQRLVDIVGWAASGPNYLKRHASARLDRAVFKCSLRDAFDSSCSMESSVALSAESTLTLTEREKTPTPVNGLLTRTPVLRRRRSNVHANLRRNYR
ncbi:hypothetical protein Aduo_016168 [Ancylostoma duodenale]